MASVCPNCGFTYAWDGAACGHCHHPRPADQPRDRLLEELAHWKPWIWIPGLLLAGLTAWYPADRWQSYREETPAWCWLTGGLAAMALASAALLPARSPWWAKAVRWAVSALIYLFTALVVWFATMMRDGFGAN